MSHEYLLRVHDLVRAEEAFHAAFLA